MINWIKDLFKNVFSSGSTTRIYINSVETKDFPTKSWDKMWGHFGKMFDEMGEMFDTMSDVMDEVVEKYDQKKQNPRRSKD